MTWKLGVSLSWIFLLGESILVCDLRNCWPIYSIPAQPAAGWLGRCFVVLQLIFMIMFVALLRIPCEAFAAIYLLLIAAISHPEGLHNDGIHVVAHIGKQNEARSTWNPIVRENSVVALAVVSLNDIIVIRSEERRVGKE